MLTPIAPSSTLLFSRYITWQVVCFTLSNVKQFKSDCAHTCAIHGLLPFGLRLLLSSLEVMPLRPPSAMSAVGATQDSKRVGRQLAGGSTHSYLFCSRLPRRQTGHRSYVRKTRTNGTIRHARA